MRGWWDGLRDAVRVWLALWRLKRLVRQRATRHAAIVAHALFSGSTQAYTLTEDLPREADSTMIRWDD